MLNNFSVFCRLLLCLLLSVAVHGSLVLLGATIGPAKPSVATAPVAISLMPLSSDPIVSRVDVNPLPQKRPDHPKQRTAVRESVPVRKNLAKRAPAKPPLKKLPDEPLPAVEVAESEHSSVAPVSACAEQQKCPVSPPVVTARAAQSPVTPAREMMSATVLAGQQQGARQTEEALAVEGATSVASSSMEAVPDYRSNPLPDYPLLARKKHWQGVVWLLVDVSAQGLVEAVRVEQSCGHRVLDQAAKRAVSRWQFFPAKRAGLAMASQVRVPVRFELENG